MQSAAVPNIFSIARRGARAARARHLSARPDAANWLYQEMQSDVVERLQFIRFAPKRALLVGLETRDLAQFLTSNDCDVMTLDWRDEEVPMEPEQYDCIVTLGTLDTVNDLPGAMLHYRQALRQDGLFLAQITGAGSLPTLRQIMLAADDDCPAARIHPQIDTRAATGLFERSGFKRQVVDSSALTLSYRSLSRLVQDLREQGLTSTLSDKAPILTRAALARAEAAFDAMKNDQGRVTETFEVLTLTGWR